MSTQILHRDDLPLGGFAGLKEHRLIVDKRVGGGDDTWDGMGNLVYLADARFLPKGETRLHPHKEIDVLSIMVEGRILHEGSLEHGKAMNANQAQAQRAGGEGFVHNEINPDDQQNRMLQFWVLPETPGQAAGYKFYDIAPGQLTTIYGGSKHQRNTFDSQTIMQVGRFDKGQNIKVAGKFIAYMVRGAGKLNAIEIQEGDLTSGEGLGFTAIKDDVLLVIVTHDKDQ